MKRLMRACGTLMSAVGAVFFVPSAWLGGLAVLLLALEPGLLLSGLAATAAAVTYGLAVDRRPLRQWGGTFLLNPALAGLAVGYFYQFDTSSGILAAILGVGTYKITCLLASVCGARGLPVLSLPFSIGAVVAFAAIASYPELVPTQLSTPYPLVLGTDRLPVAVQRFCVAFGSILFLPHVAAGALLFAGTVLCSRILGLLAVLGYVTGSLVEAGLQTPVVSHLPYARDLNYCLTAMALGGVFTVPSRLSLALAAIAVAATVVVTHALANLLGVLLIPVFALPFNLVALVFLNGLKHVGYHGLPAVVERTPEQTLSSHIFRVESNKQAEAAIHLPFAGTWSVYQGDRDQWTHQGPWQHAIDFVRVDEAGKTHEGDGGRLEQYHAYRQPVRAPVSGYVVSLESRLPDNPIGRSDRERNWGNYLIIRDLSGFHVEISHLAQDSLTPQIGQFVNIGDVVGACGNSGYSPQPHIHLQVQRSPYLGEATVPFHFHGFVSDETLFLNQLPGRNQLVASIQPNAGLHGLMEFVLDQRLEFAVERAGISRDSMHLTVRMDDVTGEFYFEDDHESRLFFIKSADLLFFRGFRGRPGSPLQVLYAAAPVIPLTFGQPLSWQTLLPLDMQFTGWRRHAVNSVTMFAHGLLQRRCRFYNDTSGTEIRGEVFWHNRYQSTVCRIDPRVGLAELACGDHVLRRVTLQS